MQVNKDIMPQNARRTLKDYIPLVISFFLGLMALSIYQNVYLYVNGVLDHIFNKSLFLFLLHHTGFTALIALLLAFLFNYLESRKPNLGFKTVRVILLVLLGVEGLLIAFYVQNYEILGVGVFGISSSENIRFFLLPIVLMLLLTAVIFHYAYKSIAKFYQLISRMYPFTLILFSLFLATLNSQKKPVNENKTQHLVVSVAQYLFDFNAYEGKEKFPLLKTSTPEDRLGSYFNLSEQKPNLVFIIVEGLGADFVGAKAKFKGFTPFLDTLSRKSLRWSNFVSNTGTGFAALPTVIGSLPFGENGFTNSTSFTNRHTLYSILKENGYATSFNYGGNSALHHFDKFLDEERVDFIVDKNAFDDRYQLQEEDNAGISLGYPDGELFKKWNDQKYIPKQPRLEVFFTLSTKNPYLIPQKKKYEQQVAERLNKLSLSKRAKKLASKNQEIFASLLYTDTQLQKLFNYYETKASYENTIFIITGSHNNTDLPHDNNLGRYRVPLLVYSPLLKTSKEIQTLTSHADITPSILALLTKKYILKTPKAVAWLGESLVADQNFQSSKQIPLFRDKNNIQDYILGDLFLSGGSVYEFDEGLNFSDTDTDEKDDMIKANFRYFKSVNSYVTTSNSLIPDYASFLKVNTSDFSKSELVWIESVFNGKDIDNAYNTARQLAFDKDWKRALLLCKYILHKTPRHADTEILMGRVYSWQKNYKASEETLKEAIRKYPRYEDSYAALLDTYYWADTNEKALVLLQTLERNEVTSNDIRQKVLRAKAEIAKKTKANKPSEIANR